MDFDQFFESLNMMLFDNGLFFVDETTALIYYRQDLSVDDAFLFISSDYDV